MLSNQAMFFIDKVIVVVGKGRYMDQAFDKKLLKLYKDTKARHPGDKTREDLADLILHKLGFFKIYYFTLCLHGLALLRRGMQTCFG